MSLSAINIPLVALFGLSYGLGHPALAPYRPALVDKTLVSFHDDLNRTAKDLNDGLTSLSLARSVLARASEAPPVRIANPAETAVEMKTPDVSHARNALGLPDYRLHNSGEPVRVKVPGFTELKAR